MVNALRLAAAFARLNQPAADKEGLTCGKLVLQNSRGFWNGTDLDLTVGEYRIIELLASRPGQYFTYRAIYDRLRHEGFVSGRGPNGYRVNVRSAIKRIRNKFRAFDPTFQEIESYTGLRLPLAQAGLIGPTEGSEETTRSALAATPAGRLRSRACRRLRRSGRVCLKRRSETPGNYRAAGFRCCQEIDKSGVFDPSGLYRLGGCRRDR